jgi:hypothetical protein
VKRLIVALALLAPVAVYAETPEASVSPPPPAQQRPAQAFGSENPTCLQWTDGCIVCKRQSEGDPACSMVGATCLPAQPACLASAR